MTQGDAPVLFARDGAVAILTLNRPVQRNAVNKELAEHLRIAVAELEADSGLRAAVLIAAGQAFCAGMDLEAFLNGDGDAILFGQNRFAGFVDAERSKPIITAIEGPAFAGGLEIALACDMIVASTAARFAVPEVKVGLFPVAGGAFRLARKIPASKAPELCLTGEAIDAAEAYRLGLVNRLVAEGEALAEAMSLAKTIAANAPLGVASAYQIGKMQAQFAERDLWELSERLWQAVRESADAQEGPAAFKARRIPQWQGK